MASKPTQIPLTHLHRGAVLDKPFKGNTRVICKSIWIKKYTPHLSVVIDVIRLILRQHCRWKRWNKSRLSVITWLHKVFIFNDHEYNDTQSIHVWEFSCHDRRQTHGALSQWISTSLLPLRWRHNGGDGISNHQPHDCLLNRLFRRRSKETSKPRVTGLCVGNSSETGEFPAQMASNAEKVSISWRHHAFTPMLIWCFFFIGYSHLLSYVCYICVAIFMENWFDMWDRIWWIVDSCMQFSWMP